MALTSYKPCTTSYGIDSVSHLAPKIWNQIPTEIKKLQISKYI